MSDISKQEYADEMEATAKKVFKIIGFAILGIVFMSSVGFVVMWLWNWLMPDLFGLKEITYWKGVGILVLFRILFGGFGTPNNNNKPSENKSGEVRGFISQAIHEEMQKEFYKEYEKKCTHEPQTVTETVHGETGGSASENASQDALYEKWWAEEGEAKFEDYLQKIVQKEE